MRSRKQTNKNKYIRKRQGGFTLAELLIALGIFSILLSIGMVALIQYKRSLKLIEMDATAREIFITASNRITTAKASGLWERLIEKHKDDLDGYFGNSMEEQPSDYPATETWPNNGKGDGHDYRYIVYDGNEDTLKNKVLDVILPFGSIDEEVRSEGCYVIEYDYATGAVYGVFYTDDSKKIGYEKDIMGVSGLNHKKGRETSSEGKEARKNYKNDNGRMIIGYYGGAMAKDLVSANLTPIDIMVDNGDTLKVIIKDDNYGKIINGIKAKTKIALTVLGEESQASMEKILEIDTSGIWKRNGQEDWWTSKVEQNSGIYTLTLDDITRQGGHFADIFPDFIPGENIIIEAEAFSNHILSTPVKAQAYTSSLFEAIYDYEENGRSASRVTIGNIRHLQNLSPEVSNIPTFVGYDNQGAVRIVEKAEQIKSLDWNTFSPVEQEKDISIYSYNEITTLEKKLAENKFYGITNTALIEYEGNGHTISNFNNQENEHGNVGLFSQVGGETISQNLIVKNLILDNFISETQVAEGNAGTLVGEVTKKGTLTVQNIIVTNPTVIAGHKGNAGGLIGKMDNGILESSGIYLTDDENSIENKKTASEKYELGAYNDDKKTVESKFLISSTGGAAGGIAGKIENTVIRDSFASVPVVDKSNGTAGGFVGKITGNTGKETFITNSYAGGYTKDGNYSKFYGVSTLGDNGIAGGFLGQDSAQKAVVKNSYSTVSVYGNTTGGFLGAVDIGGSIYKNCYATGTITGVNENSARDGFIGKKEYTATVSVEKCYYLKDSSNDLGSSVSGVTGLDYEGLKNAVYADDEGKPVSATTGTKVECYSYDKALNGVTYPFGLVTKTGAKDETTGKVHYGDWPKKVVKATEDIGLVYYEIIDNKLYYHGYFANFSENESQPNYREIMTKGNNLVNGFVADPDKYVTEDGYLILLPKGTDKTKIAVSVGNAKINANERWRLSDCVQNFKKESLLSMEGYDAYYFSKEPNIYDISYITLGENTNQYYPEFGNYVSFNFNPYFADSVNKEKPEKEQFYIRSARHLLNVSKLVWSHTSNENIEFIQTLDVSYENMTFTKNGIETSYDFKTIPSISADYTVKTYKRKDETRGYVIKGLTKTLFGSINQASLIKGVTLINSLVNGSESFTNSNLGVIDSCSVHAENPRSDSYSSVMVETQYNGAGFIHTNSGTIRNSYFIGTVIGDAVSGFVDTNEGTIENSYANVILKGSSTAAGFVRYNNSGTIKNSFVVGYVSSTGKNSVSSGFMGEGSLGMMKNCYTALFQLSGKEIYRFGKGRGKNYIDCIWLDNSYIEGEVQEGDPNDLKEIGTAMDYEDMIKKATSPKTYKYNSDYANVDKEKTVYPFELLSAADVYLPMEFWGDWPKEDIILEAGLVYYEIVEGKVYYHGYLSKYDKTLEHPKYEEVMTPGYKDTNGLLEESGKYVTEEGYMILMPVGTLGSSVGTSYGAESYHKLEDACEKVDEAIMSQFSGLEGYEAYYIILDKIPQPMYENQPVTVQVGRNHGLNKDIIMDEYTVQFTFQPLYGDTVKPFKDVQNTFAIRSPRHLENIKKEWSSVDYTFIQSADITFLTGKVSYTERGQSRGDYEFTDSINHFQSDYVSKTYQIDGKTYRYVIEGLDKNLFNNIEKESTVEGVTLVDSKPPNAVDNNEVIEQ